MRNDQVQTSTMHSVTETGGVQSPQQSQVDHTRNRITDVTFTSLQCTLHGSAVVLQIRRVHEDQAQHCRASMISCSYRDVRKQCALQKLQRQRALAITTVGSAE